MKIVFFGEDSFSNIVLKSLINKGHNVVLVVSPYYDNLIYKRLENTCIKNNIEYLRVINLKDNGFINKLKGLNPDLFVITHFEKLLKKDIIDIPKKGCINLHPSLLPYYRGMAPQHWPIINGDKETGITVHYVDETADTGDIILQKRINIKPEWYVYDLQMAFIDLYKSIVVEAIDLINSKDFVPIVQKHLKGSYYKKLKREQCKIDLNKSCSETMNLIRGVSKPYFGAYIDDIIIWKAHIARNYDKNKLENSDKIGLRFSKKMGYYLVLRDGVIIIDKYEKIIKDERKSN